MPVDLTGLMAAVERSNGLKASAAELIRGFSTKVQEAVTAALEADANADQASIDAANAAIKQVENDMNAKSDELASALGANPGPGEPPAPSERRR